MSLMSEYIAKGWANQHQQLEKELQRLIGEYNKRRGTFLLVYAAAMDKDVPQVPLSTEDYHVIFDVLRTEQPPRIDVYLETPGGSGEAAEEIVRLLHDKCGEVAFVISGEAKSAGTIMALSGNSIIMTKSGSLGPIDAQIRIGRSFVSAYDYLQWLEEKRKEAAQTQTLNPIDAMIVAQISPGELSGVHHALELAKDLLKDWLPRYKFATWNHTETRKIPVTDQMKRERADRIADELTKHSKWRSHGRSLQIEELEAIGLKIERADDDAVLAELIYRIQTVLRLLFGSTPTFKVFATDKVKIMRGAVPAQIQAAPVGKMSPKPDNLQINLECPQCHTNHKVFLKFSDNPEAEESLKAAGFSPFPQSGKLHCSCGFELDLRGVRNDLEMKTGSRAIV